MRNRKNTAGQLDRRRLIRGSTVTLPRSLTIQTRPLFHIYNKVTAFYITDIRLLCTSGRATSSVTYAWYVIYYLCYIFLQKLLSIPKKCAFFVDIFCTLHSPRALPPPSGQFYISCSGYKQKYSTHLFKTLPHAQQTRG